MSHAIKNLNCYKFKYEGERGAQVICVAANSWKEAIDIFNSAFTRIPNIKYISEVSNVLVDFSQKMDGL